MLRGCVTSSGVRVSVEDALTHAWSTGSFDGYDVITLSAMLKRKDRDYLGMSTVFGGTIRQAVLEYIYDYYVDLSIMWHSIRGTWLHKGFECVPVPDGNVIREKSLTAKVGGYKIEGTVDLYIPYLQAVYDLKSVGRIYQTLPYEKHIGQLSGYRWLLQKNGYKVSNGYILYITFSEYKMVQAEFWPDSLVVKTIEDAIPLFFDGIRRGIIPSKQWCNTKICAVCPVREICESEPDNEKPRMGTGVREGERGSIDS